jgi:hypothetical protein
MSLEQSVSRTALKWCCCCCCRHCSHGAILFSLKCFHKHAQTQCLLCTALQCCRCCCCRHCSPAQVCLVRLLSQPPWHTQTQSVSRTALQWCCCCRHCSHGATLWVLTLRSTVSPPTARSGQRSRLPSTTCGGARGWMESLWRWVGGWVAEWTWGGLNSR